jgi:hypothetical protein
MGASCSGVFQMLNLVFHQVDHVLRVAGKKPADVLV